MRAGPSSGEYATAVLVDEVCDLWPECGCDIDCAGARPFETRPKFHLVEKLLLVLLVASAIVGGWCAFT